MWHGIILHIPKQSRYTLGAKIDIIFIEIIEKVFSATGAAKIEKLPYLLAASQKLDTLKFLLLIAWEIKILDNKKYILISEPLNEIGRMLGGWHRKIANETPAEYAGEKRQ